jgi:hypothetical protein
VSSACARPAKEHTHRSRNEPGPFVDPHPVFFSNCSPFASIFAQIMMYIPHVGLQNAEKTGLIPHLVMMLEVKINIRCQREERLWFTCSKTA